MKKNKAILDISISGMLIGIACFFLKISLSGIRIDSYIIITLLSIPFMWIAIFLAMVGFFFMQRAFYEGSISKTVPILAVISIAIPVILAVLFLKETITPLKIIAIVLMISGIFGLSLIKRKK